MGPEPTTFCMASGSWVRSRASQTARLSKLACFRLLCAPMEQLRVLLVVNLVRQFLEGFLDVLVLALLAQQVDDLLLVEPHWLAPPSLDRVAFDQLPALVFDP